MLFFDRILDLLNTDGSFSLDFKKDSSMPIKYRLNPVVQLTQNDMDLLEIVRDTLKSMGIKSEISKSTPSNTSRAPRLKVEGIGQVRNFCSLVHAKKAPLIRHTPDVWDK